LRLLEARLRTGRMAHLLGGALDVAGALIAYARAHPRGHARRARTRAARGRPRG
jgi:hypothetical protein